MLAEHQLVVSSQIFSELRRALRDKFGTSGELIDAFVRLLQRDTIVAEVRDLPTLKLKDKDDLGILAAAESGDASVIVTGDKELQDLGSFKGIAILSPRQFWQQLTRNRLQVAPRWFNLGRINTGESNAQAHRVYGRFPATVLHLQYADGVAGDVDLSSLVGKGVFCLVE